ncbi:hydrogenase maturation protease [uncultured Desulfobulbus sp.]|uniref:hydrogenase maturation protease n=1 Tax=uncultured Desulfobulbus sp. TaxID=239745 RepID=UPI0029C71A38|nr:hydrogenase maturation protease [uncultured Desulfobulbus sp.]
MGNSLVAADAAGLHVFDELRTRSCCHQVEIINGGLGGLDLLPFFYNCDTVILVDRVVGFAEPGAVVHLGWDILCADWHGGYSPSSELLYLLKSLPFLGVSPMPSVCMIGIEGAGARETIKLAADMALEVAHETP